MSCKFEMYACFDDNLSSYENTIFYIYEMYEFAQQSYRIVQPQFIVKTFLFRRLFFCCNNKLGLIKLYQPCFKQF